MAKEFTLTLTDEEFCHLITMIQFSRDEALAGPDEDCRRSFVTLEAKIRAAYRARGMDPAKVGL
jgi:hypothetical protein